RDWIIPGLLMRRHVTVLVAPSGAGKSLLTLQVGIACALDKEWAGWRPRRKFRVLVINSEDDVDEIRRRLCAASVKMNIKDQQILADDFLLADTSNGIIVAKFDNRTKTMIAQPLLDQLIETVKANKIDVIFVDPFAETFEGDENSNSELKWAGYLWRRVARETNAAVCLIHHTKKYATGMQGDVDAARGAGALIGIARIVSTVFPMTKQEAEGMSIEEDERPHFLRYDDAKANLNLTCNIAKWFRKDTVRLDNATKEQPADDVGALVPYKPPGLMDGILQEQIDKFFDAVDRGICDKDGNVTGEFYTFDTRKQSESEMSRYVGEFAMEFFGIKKLDKAAKMINAWRDSKWLIDGEKYRSPKTRKERTRCVSHRFEADNVAPIKRSNEEEPSLM
ncbi:MAG: hypothetical protein C5B60_08460, partial [Chloroflexi bacterium]